MRLKFDEAAQIRMAHWLAQWGFPFGTLIVIGAIVTLLETCS